MRGGVIGIAPAVAVGIIDDYTGLYVETVDIEGHRRSAVFHGIGFHLYTGTQEIVSFKNRGDAVKHVISGAAYIIRHLIFIGKHAFHVHIPGAGDEIALIGVLPGELKSDDVTSVVQIVVLDEIVISDQMPSAGMNGADGFSFVCGHQVFHPFSLWDQENHPELLRGQ